MKRGLVLLTLLLISVNLISAYSPGAGLDDILNSFDDSTIILSLLFVIFFTTIQFILKRFMKNEDGNSSVIISLAISLLMVFQINRMNYGFDNFFYEIGLYGENLFYLGLIAFIALATYLLTKFKSTAMIVLGAIMIFLSFTNFFIDLAGILLLLGLILLIGGIIAKTMSGGEDGEESNFKWGPLFVGIMAVILIGLLIWGGYWIIANPLIPILILIAIIVVWVLSKQKPSNLYGRYKENKKVKQKKEKQKRIREKLKTIHSASGKDYRKIIYNIGKQWKKDKKEIIKKFQQTPDKSERAMVAQYFIDLYALLDDHYQKSSLDNTNKKKISKAIKVIIGRIEKMYTLS